DMITRRSALFASRRRPSCPRKSGLEPDPKRVERYQMVMIHVGLEELTAARRSGCDGRDNQDESDAPVSDRREGVARPEFRHRRLRI
ncbi:MAG TPA: hypothetical protein VIS95_10595, partial [Solirubrobacterales bacterium]